MRVVTCGDTARAHWAPLTGDAVTELPAVPTRDDLDPLLDEVPDGGRLAVAGDDAAVAALLVRLLRRERLGIELALLPAPWSPAAVVWGLPTDREAALALARDGVARPVPLLRDDHGGLVVGRHETGPLHGEVYVDEHRVVQGDVARLAVAPDPEGGVTVTATGPRRLGGLRAGPVTTRSGRAAQLGCRPPVVITRDGVPGERPVPRRSWYRHTADWLLVRAP
ncbi:hypothetical protein GCM10023200_02390 [Actinomycetospora chlora]|uniref:DAGKc domain-containing protein n=1 Tax=Actinomycetospora chlora TaxID=663608 RepID=A0ABP9A4F7_9PSEU